MTTPFLAQDISRDEGLRLKAYGDPLTGAEPWTCGYGCTGPDVGPETVWTIAEAAARRDAKIAEAEADLDRHIGWWRTLSDPRQDVLVNMVYNMGWPHLAGFHRFMEAAEGHGYDLAAGEMLNSQWARQVHARATRLAEQFRTGVRQP